MNTIVNSQYSTGCANVRQVTWLLNGGSKIPEGAEEYTDGYTITSTIYGGVTTAKDVLFGACVIFMVNQGTTEDY